MAAAMGAPNALSAPLLQVDWEEGTREVADITRMLSRLFFDDLAESARGALGASLLAATHLGGKEDLKEEADLEAGAPRKYSVLPATLAPAVAARAAEGQVAVVNVQCSRNENETADIIIPSVDKTAVEDARMEHAEEVGLLTVVEGSFTMTNYLMNFGIFSVPLVFVQAGYAAVPLVFFAAAACIFTSRLLGRILEQLSLGGIQRPCYREAAFAAGGQSLAVLINWTCHLELGAYACGNLVVLGHTLSDLVPGLGFAQVAIGSTIVGMVLSAISDKVYSYVSLFSAVSISTSCSLVVLSGWELPEWAKGDRPMGELSLLPSSLAMLIFCAACHPVLPSIYHNMRSRTEFEKATWNGWVFWAFFSAAFGAVVYYMMGDSVQVIVTRNIGKTLDMQPLPSTCGLAAASAGCVSLRLQGAQVPLARPFAEGLSQLVGVKIRRGNGGLTSALLSAPILVAIGVAAYLLQEKIAVLEAISASLLMAINAFLFPAFAYVRVCKPEGTWAKVGSMAAAAFGAGMAVSVSISYLH